MEMHQVRYFLTACETLNFSRAAAQCDVSVTSLSRAIRTLEDELGGQLFRRERHLTHLTDLGRLMQRHLKTAQAATDAAKREAEDYARLHGSRFTLGVFASISAGVLTDYLVALRADAPELHVQIRAANCEDLESALLSNEIDIALTSATRFDERIRAISLYREAYHVAFAPGHRFEKMTVVPIREFKGEDFIKRLHCEFPSNFEQLGVANPDAGARVRYSGEREDWVQAMVRAGLGVTLMPEHLPLIGGIALRKLVEPEISRQVSLVTVAGRPHSSPVEAAMQAAQRHRWPEGPNAGGMGDDA